MALSAVFDRVPEFDFSRRRIRPTPCLEDSAKDQQRRVIFRQIACRGLA